MLSLLSKPLGFFQSLQAVSLPFQQQRTLVAVLLRSSLCQGGVVMKSMCWRDGRFLDEASLLQLLLLTGHGDIRQCTPEFQVRIARFKFIPVSETAIEHKHFVSNVTAKKATNIGPVALSIANRKKMLQHAMSTWPMKFVEQFGMARRLSCVPSLLGLSAHPLILQQWATKQSQKPSAIMKPLTAIVYHTDYTDQFNDLSAQKQAHIRKRDIDVEIEVAASGHVNPALQRDWEAKLFWEHTLAQAERGLMISVPLFGHTGQVGSFQSIDTFFSGKAADQVARAEVAAPDLWVADGMDATDLTELLDRGLDEEGGGGRQEPSRLFMTMVKALPASGKHMRVSAGLLLVCLVA